MLKKLAILIGCISLFWLAGCSNEPDEVEALPEPPTQPQVEVEPEVEPELEFTVEIFDGELASLGGHNEVNYSEIVGFGVENDITLKFTFSDDITNFAFISLANRAAGDIAKTGVLHEVGNVVVDEPLILSQYFERSNQAIFGFAFDDPAGNGKWFSLGISPMDGEIVWQEFDWSHDNELYIAEAPWMNSANGENATGGAIGGNQPGTHTVLAGETLFSIASLHGTTVAALQQLNNLGTSTNIQAGQVLIVGQGGVSGQNGLREINITALLVDDVNALEMDFTEVEYSTDAGRDILIQTEAVLNNLQIVGLSFYNQRTEVAHIRHEFGNFNSTGVLSSLLLRSHFEIGSMVTTGFIFTDEDGVRRAFVMPLSHLDENQRSLSLVEVDI